MRHKNGQSLIEVIIAATVGILVVTALTFATIFSLRNANFAKTSAQATKLAQEGIERVRTGRNRNSSIRIPGTTVNSWNGTPGVAESAIWDYRITGAGLCDYPSLGGKCYFNVNSIGALTNIGFAFVPTATTPLPVLAENIPPMFKRVVILSDENTGTPPRYTVEKKVTVIVRWSDSTGAHESKLTTILGKKF